MNIEEIYAMDKKCSIGKIMLHSEGNGKWLGPIIETNITKHLAGVDWQVIIDFIGKRDPEYYNNYSFKDVKSGFILFPAEQRII